MEITATDPAPGDGTCNYLAGTSDVGLVESARVDGLNFETVTSNPLLPTDRKWAIRFNAGGTATIILGMKHYGRGWLSAYFAGLAAARLGIPFRRFCVYYSATFPAVLQTPIPFSGEFHRCRVNPTANAVADVVERMCEGVIEKGKSAFAVLAGVGVMDVGFDPQTGRFFFLETERSASFFEMAEATRGESSMLVEFAGKLRRRGKRLVAKENQVVAAV